MKVYLIAVMSITLLVNGVLASSTDQPIATSQLSTEDNQPLLRIAFYDDIGTWAIDKYHNALVHIDQAWKQVTSNVKFITVGGAGVWILDKKNNAHYRQGISEYRPEGVGWTRIKGTFKSLSAGKEGFLYGIDKDGHLHCRDGFSCTNPLGKSWNIVERNESLNHVSCGKRGCWLVSNGGKVFFFNWSNTRGCEHPSLVEIELKDDQGGNVVAIEVNTSPSGWRVVAVTADGSLVKRSGLSDTTPQGTNWKTVAAKGNYKTAVPCHMGYIAVTYSSKATFITNLPQCNDFGVRLTDVDTGGKIDRPSTWGIKGALIYQNQGTTWIQVEGPAMKQISTSGDDVWAVSRYDEVYIRNGITCSNAYGDSWQKIPGRLTQIDSGKFGLVYALTQSGDVYCRTGISEQSKSGMNWLKVDGNMTYVSCGDFGCWAIDQKYNTFYRTGIEKGNCAGERWVPVPSPSPMKVVESGHHGLVFGVDVKGHVYAR